MKSQPGWTLIELMIALAIAAILCGMAGSALGNALESARALSVRNDLVASFALAATRASLTGTRAVLCPTLDAAHCSDQADWSQGWLVFMDDNASRELEGGERLLRVREALPGRVRLRSTSGRTRVVFQGNGGNVGSNVTFTLCDGRGPARAISLILANNGRLREGPPDPENLLATCPP